MHLSLSPHSVYLPHIPKLKRVVTVIASVTLMDAQLIYCIISVRLQDADKKIILGSVSQQQKNLLGLTVMFLFPESLS